MKIKVNQETLCKALQKVTNIIGSRTTLPVLANVWMHAEENKLTIVTTDLEIRYVTEIPAEVEESGKTTLPAKKLLGLVSRFHGDVTIESNENFHSVIRCGSAEIMLLGLNPDDFPVLTTFEVIRTIQMKQADLAELIEKISYAVSVEDSRKVLQGILLSVHEGKITAVATDGKRLALTEKMLENVPEGSDGDIIITLKSAQELKRVMDKTNDVTMEIGEKQITFHLGDTTITSKLIEGVYPNYRQVIPATFKTNIGIQCDQFIYALELLSVTLADSNSPLVKLTFKDNQLRFDANSNIGEGNESIAIEYTGEEMSASFNPHYLLDPFKHLPNDQMFLKINDVVSPIALETADGFLYVIMPMRNK